MNREDTNKSYMSVIERCLKIFLNKAEDYGTSWRVLRQISIVDQIHIKLNRINTILQNKDQKIEDSVDYEYLGIINYSVIGLIQLEFNDTNPENLDIKTVESMFNKQVRRSYDLMLLKNHDYGEAWRFMSEESFIDLMLMKIYRMKNIIKVKNGKTTISEGIDANYLDIINYCVFNLINTMSGNNEDDF